MRNTRLTFANGIGTILSRPAALTLALPLILGLSTTPPVRADTTLIADTRLSGLSEESRKRVPAARTVTYYIKGDQTRVESVAAGEDGEKRRVTLYDRKAGRVYLIEDETKTYAVLPLKDVMKDSLELPRQARGRASLTREIKIEEQKGSAPVTVAGQTTRPFTLDGRIKVEPKIGGLFGGGRRGGGRGGNGGGLPEAQIDGSLSGADSARLAGSAPGSGDSLRAFLLPFAREMFPGGATFRPLLDRLTDRKIIPLASRVRFTPKGGRASSPLVAETMVRSISDSPLDASLFIVPKDYKEVAPPERDGSLGLLFGRGSTDNVRK